MATIRTVRGFEILDADCPDTTDPAWN